MLELLGCRVEMVADGQAAEAGIRRGDVLLRFGTSEIKNVKQLKELVAAAPANKPLPILVRRGDNTLYLALEPLSRNG